MFTAIIFVIVLSVLIFVHELGHFMVAKRAGMKVEEFGFGFPPRALGIKRGETIYSINWIPFGGFVRILGEDDKNTDNPRSFAKGKASTRAFLVSAGVLMNLLLAVILLSIVNAAGLRVGLSDNDLQNAKNVKIQIVQVANDSPAQKAGLTVLDEIRGIIINGTNAVVKKVTDVQNIINSNTGKTITLDIYRGKEEIKITAVPRINPPVGQGALGISLTATGIVSYPWYQAIYQGFQDTFLITRDVFVGYGSIIGNVFRTGKAGVELTGPVGIAVVTGQAAKLGLIYLLQFTALISINLGVLNIIPFPALDGGRLLFIIIEKIKGSPVSKSIEANINTIGFGLLLALMLYITTKDVIRLF